MRRLTCGPPGPATRDPPRHGEESRTSLAVSGIAAVEIARCGFESRSAPSRPGRRRWPRRDATTIADGDGSRASKAPGERIEHPRHSHPLPPFPPHVLCAELKGAQSRVSARTGIGMPRTNRRAIIPTDSIAGKSMRSVIDSSTLTLTLDLQAGATGANELMFFAYVFLCAQKPR